jgi:hypothetical protein
MYCIGQCIETIILLHHMVNYIMVFTGIDSVPTNIIIFSHTYLANSSVTHVTIQMYDKCNEVERDCPSIIQCSLYLHICSYYTESKLSFFYCYFCGCFLFVLLVFHKLLEPKRYFTLKVNVHISNDCISANWSQESRLYCTDYFVTLLKSSHSLQRVCG